MSVRRCSARGCVPYPRPKLLVSSSFPHTTLHCFPHTNPRPALARATLLCANGADGDPPRPRPDHRSHQAAERAGHILPFVSGDSDNLLRLSLTVPRVSCQALWASPVEQHGERPPSAHTPQPPPNAPKQDLLGASKKGLPVQYKRNVGAGRTVPVPVLLGGVMAAMAYGWWNYGSYVLNDRCALSPSAGSPPAFWSATLARPPTPSLLRANRVRAWCFGVVRREIQEEKHLVRVAITPFLQAEADYRFILREDETKAWEKETMKDVPGYKAGESVYHSKTRWQPPATDSMPRWA
eukprot:COSAG06_NODE_4213_length_4471_cov_2.922919_1_plen_295_part_00